MNGEHIPYIGYFYAADLDHGRVVGTVDWVQRTAMSGLEWQPFCHAKVLLSSALWASQKFVFRLKWSDRVRVSWQRLKRSHFPEDSELMQCHFHHTLLFPPTCRRKESRSCGCSRTPQLKETWRGGGSFSITVPGYSTLVRCHNTAACDSRSWHIHSQKQREISVYIFSGVCSAPYTVQPWEWCHP